MPHRSLIYAGVVACVAGAAAPAAHADDDAPPHFSNFGGVGLLETRSARMAPDATFATTVSVAQGLQRYNLMFQATPWLEGTFSYQLLERTTNNGVFDRRFDLKFRLIEETETLPQVAFGLQDFLGTGLFSAEYFVASKRFGPLDFSAGVGWGRMASRGALTNPFTVLSDRFDTRDTDTGVGGTVNFGQYFQGENIGFFGGLIYDTPIDGLRLIAEYDSDDKSEITTIDDRIPFNFGVAYTPIDGFTMTGFVLQGSSVGVTATLSADVSRNLLDTPKADPGLQPFAVREGRGLDSGLDPAPAPPLQPLVAAPLPPDVNVVADQLSERLREEEITLRRVVLADNALQVEVENRAYRPQPQAVGRVARVLSELAPETVETFHVVLVDSGMPVAQVDINRERLEISARERGYTASPPQFVEAYRTVGVASLEGEAAEAIDYPRFRWSVGPSIRTSTFDPDDPLRYQIDALATAAVEPLSGFFLEGAVRTELFGTFDDITRGSDSVLPRVRSEFAQYYRNTDVGIDYLTGSYYFSPADNVYAKVSAGLLERHFAGFGGEILYRPPNAPRWAWGAEVYYAHQRGFNTAFDLRDYNIVTGHVSAYYASDFYDFDFAVHAGRYLAGDWGATFEVRRRFNNGWEVGAFATFTDVPFDEFGEGSFDKGLLITVPLDWGLPYETRSRADLLVRPVQRDGGQRLGPRNRLHEVTLPSAAHEMGAQWHEFSN